MVEDDKFTEVAKTDFKMRLVAGFIFGILATLISLVFIIVSFINNNLQFALALIAMVVVGLGVSASCGYFLFRKEKKETEEIKKE